MWIVEEPTNDKEDSGKISCLKPHVGDKGLEVFERYTFDGTGDAKKLDIVLKKFQEYCISRKNH